MSTASRGATPSPPPVFSRAHVAGMFAMAMIAGSVIPVQGRLNARLAELSGSPTLTAFASFCVGLAVMIVITVATPRGRRTWAQVAPALRAGRVRWWYFLAGIMGGFMVLSQSLTIGVIGVAIFTVAVVAGQLVGGMTVDRLGLTPAGVRYLTPRRVAGAAMAMGAVLVVVWPRLSPGAGTIAGSVSEAAGAVPTTVLLLVALIPLAVGVGTSAQQVLNARQSAAYRSAIPVTLINFVAGASFLGLIAVATGAVTGEWGSLPGTWWLYLGGALGCVFIGFSAILVPRIGAFLTTLGVVSGKLLGSLVVDAVAPTAGSQFSVLTLVGTAAALVAVQVASWPSRRLTTLK
ncbi:MAG: DMT family transporter [Micrococcus sp.]|nr:DMT family transporter [Micrococcus sp.]